MAVSASTDATRLDALVQEARRRVQLERSRNLAIGAVLLVLVVVTSQTTEFSIPAFIKGGHNMGRVLAGFLHPDLSILGKADSPFREGLVPHYILETLATAVLGTTLGSVIAIPVSFLAARNLMRRTSIGTAIYFAIRTLMSIVRAVPTIFWGLLFVTAVSIGPFPGVLATSLFTFGLMSKLFSEAIEAIDWGQVEALTATGANSIQVVINGVLPQVLPYMIAHLLYTFEVNVHSATILGIVGAGGIGFLFSQYIQYLDYEKEATVLIVVILMTMTIDYSSAAVRRRII